MIELLKVTVHIPIIRQVPVILSKRSPNWCKILQPSLRWNEFPNWRFILRLQNLVVANVNCDWKPPLLALRVESESNVKVSIYSLNDFKIELIKFLIQSCQVNDFQVAVKGIEIFVVFGWTSAIQGDVLISQSEGFIQSLSSEIKCYRREAWLFNPLIVHHLGLNLWSLIWFVIVLQKAQELLLEHDVKKWP